MGQIQGGVYVDNSLLINVNDKISLGEIAGKRKVVQGGATVKRMNTMHRTTDLQLTNSGEPRSDLHLGAGTDLYTTSCTPLAGDWHMGGGTGLFTTSCDPMAAQTAPQSAQQAA